MRMKYTNLETNHSLTITRMDDGAVLVEFSSTLHLGEFTWHGGVGSSRGVSPYRLFYPGHTPSWSWGVGPERRRFEYSNGTVNAFRAAEERVTDWSPV
jgi:hypothetical protein